MDRILKRMSYAALIALGIGQAAAQPVNPGGVFVAGDLWETFLPTNVGKNVLRTSR